MRLGRHDHSLRARTATHALAVLGVLLLTLGCRAAGQRAEVWKCAGGLPVEPGRYESSLVRTPDGSAYREVLAVRANGSYWRVFYIAASKGFSGAGAYAGHLGGEGDRIRLVRTDVLTGSAHPVRLKPPWHTMELLVRDRKTLWRGQIAMEYRWVGANWHFRPSLEGEFKRIRR